MELEQIKGLLDLVNLEDITAIKKAYAKQVKLHHPEEEPQAFQLLQTAYREAVQYAQAQRAGHAIKVNVLQEKAEESNDESFEAVSAGSVSSCEGLVQAAPKTTDERIEELLQALQSGNTLAVKKQLQTAQRLALLQDTAFLTALSEGLQMFTALQYHDVESRMCLFPQENHELSRSGKPKHRLRRLQEMADWFDAHLK